MSAMIKVKRSRWEWATMAREGDYNVVDGEPPRWVSVVRFAFGGRLSKRRDYVRPGARS